MIQSIGTIIKNDSNKNKYFCTHFFWTDFNNKKATIKLGAKVHNKLKLFGAVECVEKNQRKTKIQPIRPVVKNKIKSKDFVLLLFLRSL